MTDDAPSGNPLKSLKGLKGNKKVVVYVGGAAAVYVGWRYWQARNAAPATVVPAGPTDTSVAQGGGGAAMVNDNVGNQVLNTPASNSEWTQRAVDLMTNQGWDPMTVSVALGKYLNGKGLTDQEIVIVQAAVALAGRPPIGTFGLVGVSNPPAPVMTGGWTSAAITGIRVNTTHANNVLLQWDPKPSAASYDVQTHGPGYSVAKRVTGPAYRAEGLKPRTGYQTRVRAQNSSGGGSSWSPWFSFTSGK